MGDRKVGLAAAQCDRIRVARNRIRRVRELLTREPNESEIRDAREVIAAGETVLDGFADFRWVVLNSNEFRFLP